VVRFMRHTAWSEPLPFADKLHSAGVTDVRQAVAVLMYPITAADTDGFVSSIQSDAATARMSFADGSTMEVPRLWRGRITDLTVTEGMASRVMTSRIPVGTIASVHERPICAQVDDIAVNQVFYRREPHMMRRYAALALDNIQRDPVGFALASGYRAVRLFVIAGTSDRLTTQQFSRSRWIYSAAMGLSIVYLTLFGIGVAMAWRRGHRVGLPLLLIAYLPATLAPVLTNMRYTLTVQPLMFMFIAVAIVTLTRSFRGERLPAT